MRGATGRSRQTGVALLCRSAAQFVAMLCGICLMVRHAAAFPASDAENPSVVTPATAAASDQSDVSALSHQLQLLNPYASSVGPGWTFTPSLTLQEAFNDNVFQSEQDRRW